VVSNNNPLQQQQDPQALLKAKYCPRVAISITHTELTENTKKPTQPWP